MGEKNKEQKLVYEQFKSTNLREIIWAKLLQIYLCIFLLEVLMEKFFQTSFRTNSSLLIELFSEGGPMMRLFSNVVNWKAF